MVDEVKRENFFFFFFFAATVAAIAAAAFWQIELPPKVDRQWKTLQGPVSIVCPFSLVSENTVQKRGKEMISA